MFYTEVLHGVRSAEELARLKDSGHMPMGFAVCLDAKSVFDALKADEPQVPAEVNLLNHLQMIKEWLNRRLLTRLWWTDTRDMVADGLTKGEVERTAICQLLEHGMGVLQHPHIARGQLHRQ